MTPPPPSENRDSGRWKQPIRDDQWIAKAQARAWGAPEYSKEIETDIRKELPRDKQPPSLTGIVNIPPPPSSRGKETPLAESAQAKAMDCPSCRIVGSTIGLGTATWALYKSLKAAVPVEPIKKAASNVSEYASEPVLNRVKQFSAKSPNRYMMAGIAIGSLSLIALLNWNSRINL